MCVHAGGARPATTKQPQPHRRATKPWPATPQQALLPSASRPTHVAHSWHHFEVWVDAFVDFAGDDLAGGAEGMCKKQAAVQQIRLCVTPKQIDQHDEAQRYEGNPTDNWTPEGTSYKGRVLTFMRGNFLHSTWMPSGAAIRLHQGQSNVRQRRVSERQLSSPSCHAAREPRGHAAIVVQGPTKEARSMRSVPDPEAAYM